MIIKKISIMGILILVSSTLMSTTGCAKETKTPTSMEFKTFSKYGFSFEYLKDFLVSETGVLENGANDNSGIVDVGVENEEFKSFQVSWIKIKTLQCSLEDGLADGLAGMEGTKGIANVERGELVETTKAGHRMVYQYYTATPAEADKAYGILGSFYCDKNQKVFVLLTMNTTISAQEDVLEDFQNYLDSFVCH